MRTNCCRLGVCLPCGRWAARVSSIAVIAFAMAAMAQEDTRPHSIPKAPRLETAESETAQSIHEMLAKQQACWNRADIVGFMDHYWKSDQLTFSSGGKTTRGWQATLDGYQKRYSTPEKMGRLSFDNLEVYSLSSDAVYVLGRWKLDREEPIQGNFSLIVKQIEDAWRIVHDHTSVDASD